MRYRQHRFNLGTCSCLIYIRVHKIVSYRKRNVTICMYEQRTLYIIFECYLILKKKWYQYSEFMYIRYMNPFLKFM